MQAWGLLRGGRDAGGWRRRAAARSSRRTGLRGRDSGMVTAELAMALPALIVMVMALAWLLGLGASQAMLSQAAREGARAAARGDSSAVVARAVHQVVGDAEVGIRQSGDHVVVSVRVRRAPGSHVLHVLGRDLRASATAWQERP